MEMLENFSQKFNLRNENPLDGIYRRLEIAEERVSALKTTNRHLIKRTEGKKCFLPHELSVSDL